MRLWLPNLPSRQLLFSQRFQNLSYVLGSGGQVSGSVSVDRGIDLSGGGYVVYSSRGADAVWQLPWWSVVAEVDVLADSVTRAVLACGDPVIGDRFEVGVNRFGEMYLDGSVSDVSDDTVAAGRHKLAWIFTGGVVEFWCDGVRIGTGTATLGSTTPPRCFVGIGSDGLSRGWGSTIYSLDVYSYPLDEQEAFVASQIT